jgi:hypothetical protein
MRNLDFPIWDLILCGCETVGHPKLGNWDKTCICLLSDVLVHLSDVLLQLSDVVAMFLLMLMLNIHVQHHGCAFV